MKKLLCFVLIFNCFIVTSFAQKNFLPATVVTTEGDTLRGLVNYRNWAKNPYKIEFKKDAAAEVETLGTDKAAWFSVEGNDVYINAIVSKDMAPVDLNHLQEKDFENVVQDTVFLRQVVKGQKLALYALEDEKMHFYLQEQDQQPVELIYKVYLNNGSSGQAITYDGYKNQLNKFAAFDEKLLKLIDKLKYNETDLKKAFIELDPSVTATPLASSPLQSKVKTVQVIAGGGITLNSLSFNGDNYHNLQDNKVGPSLGYSVRIGLDVMEKRHMQKFFLRNELALGNFNYKNTTEGQNWLGEDEVRTYTIQVKSYTIAVSGNYNFINNTNLKVYGGAGLNFNYSIYKKNNYTVYNKATGQSKNEGRLAFENKWFNFPVKVGFTKNNIDISISTSLTGTFSNFMSIGTKYRSSGLFIMYHF